MGDLVQSRFPALKTESVPAEWKYSEISLRKQKKLDEMKLNSMKFP